jgi:predicted CXXCH cytochrome family protein
MNHASIRISHSVKKSKKRKVAGVASGRRFWFTVASSQNGRPNWYFLGERKMKSIMLKSVLSLSLAMTCMTAGAGTIVGSAHDFAGQAWSGGQICVACHAPHGANTTIADAPLWNHASTAATYTVYTSTTGTLNATVGQPGSSSKLCLSCHDGTVAVNSFGGVTGTTFLTGTKNLGTNLSTSHPIGFTYDAALATADGALANPATTNVTIGSGTKIKTGFIAATMLYAGKVECASCHDVHNTFTAASGKLAKVSMAASALCTTCHIK